MELIQRLRTYYSESLAFIEKKWMFVVTAVVTLTCLWAFIALLEIRDNSRNADIACYDTPNGETCVSIRESLRKLLIGELPVEKVDDHLEPMLPRLRSDVDMLLKRNLDR